MQLKHMSWLFCFISFSLHAVLPAWQIVPEKSQVTFTSTSNDAPVLGEFQKFEGNIQFDPQQLAESQVLMTVETSSVNMGLAQLADMLKTVDWLNVATFPKAIFKANTFKKIDNQTFEADGTLTIRDKTVPMVISFTLQDYSTTHATVSGRFNVKRSAFGVGQGEWADTSEVKDEVKVDFIFSMIPHQ